jgi:hypothetical protein
VHWWIFANVSEEPGASIFKAEEQKAAGIPEKLENFYSYSSGPVSQKTVFLTRNTIFCSLDHAFSNYNERKTNEVHFQNKPHTVEPRFTNLIRSWRPFITRNVRKPKLFSP